MKLGLECNRCKGRLKPLRQPAQTLREYTLRLFRCEGCGKRVAVAWFIVNELEMGGDAVIRTANPAGVRRVDLNIPPGAFTEQQILLQELRTGTRYPEGRTGNIDASIITGQGVQALMGGFDTQVKSAQAIFASTLRDVISVCFEVDEKFFIDDSISSII